MSGLARRLMGCLPTDVPAVAADAIDFDGTNDYLRRTGLTGSYGSRQFTFSAFVYLVDGIDAFGVVNASLAEKFTCSATAGGSLIIIGRDGTGGVIFNTSMACPSNTWVHVIASANLQTGVAKVYLNDVVQSAPSTAFGEIGFNGPYAVGGTHITNPPTARRKSRISHVYLDYTYRDLSIEANRRLFITADRKPALNQQALNPILYLPLNDPTQPGKNLGTGGDFALTGVVARSGCGPSQFNAAYSDLDGSADYLRRTTAPTGIVDGKQFTFACVFNLDTVTLAQQFFTIGDGGGTSRFTVLVATSYIRLVALNPSNTSILAINTASNFLTAGRNNVLTVSMDMSDTGKRFILVNGVDRTPVSGWTYTNDNIDFTMGAYHVGCSQASTPNAFVNGHLGNVFFDTKYIDLSQPANLAKFVTGIDAKPVDMGANGELPFGTPPLIYLPMYGNNAGKNYGTGGDFTVNSGPFPGARGPSEFWGNKADFGTSSSNYLQRSGGLVGVSDTYLFSLSTSFSLSNLSLRSEIVGVNGSKFTIYWAEDVQRLFIIGFSPSYTEIYRARISGISAGVTYQLMVNADLSDSAKRGVYLNGVVATTTYDTYGGGSVDFAGTGTSIIGSKSGYGANCKLSEFYFTTDYIDFSQEADRLKFRDAFGNPVDLTPQIEAGTLPKPAIYMRFDPANFGKNSGTGGDFTVNGTITDGGQL